MKLALGQFDAIVGDLTANMASIERLATEARGRGADLLLLPEMCLLGYPPRDFLLREEVVRDCEAAVASLATRLGVPTLVGTPRLIQGGSRPIANAVALCRDGRVEAWHEKILLPTYDVFDENRWFQSGESPLVFELAGKRIGVLVCEDLWRAMDVGVDRPYRRDPVAMVLDAGCDLIVSPSASPFIVGKHARHMALLEEAARHTGLPIAMANQLGANDDLVFDGGSIVHSAEGACLCALPRFEESLEICDLDREHPVEVPETFCPDEERFRAIVMAIKGYCNKTSQRGVLLGLSGGIDSALVAALAVAALGAANVQVVLMPGRHSSEGSLVDARDSAQRLGIEARHEIPITALHGVVEESLVSSISHGALEGLADENVQARLRGLLLMALSNADGRMLLATSNKSELAVGYATLYGDMCGGMMPLGDLYKTEVFQLARWMNREHERLGFAEPPIPDASIEKPPSAELRPDQCDQDSLPPYDVLDAILRLRIDEERAPETIEAELGVDRETIDLVQRLHHRSEFKRFQATIIPKIAPRTFGRGRTMPLASRWNSGD